jgi:S1-C subfamily serine protease
VGIPGFNQPGVLIPEVASESSLVAQKAGIKPKDVILAVDGKDLGTGLEATESLKKAIQKSPNQPLKLTIQRDNKPFHLR